MPGPALPFRQTAAHTGSSHAHRDSLCALQLDSCIYRWQCLLELGIKWAKNGCANALADMVGQLEHHAEAIIKHGEISSYTWWLLSCIPRALFYVEDGRANEWGAFCIICATAMQAPKRECFIYVLKKKITNTKNNLLFPHVLLIFYSTLVNPSSKQLCLPTHPQKTLIWAG